MSRCPACAAELSSSSPFCPECGAPLGGDPTASSGPTLIHRKSSASSGSPTSDGRFPPGTMLLDRYRIVGRLGRGGMGEVFRADDMKLGQPVALKFLPADLERGSSMLARFHHEVKIARQVSHPNVCRVYDIAEADGQHFISMEYVDGEDLRSLLRRIGRLPEDKALQIARQMCAGLAAAHDKGVLHRDLKPANVMLDGEGRVRITDFGLAALAGEVIGADLRSGTPGYMAPEQVAGKEVSVASDIYALGLVLFELFTGKPAFRAESLPELMRQQESGVTSPSSFVHGLDRSVERVILACLARHPAERPSSALAVAAALPGGDPLAAALAAGETPSPEMVAASVVTGGLSARAGLISIVGAIAGLALIVLFGGAGGITSYTSLPKEPQVLAAEARALLGRTGHPEPAGDFIWGLSENKTYLDHLEKSTDPNRWKALGQGALAPIIFYYRQGPKPLLPLNPISNRMSLEDPPPGSPGIATVWTDTSGRLIRMEIVPPERAEPGGAPPGDADFSPLFAAAGLGIADLRRVPPGWNPPFHTDARLAWESVAAKRPELGVRVEAASYRGVPVFFRVIGPWEKPAESALDETTTGKRVAQFAGGLLLLSVLTGGFLLARRNVRLGRSDLRGAVRIAGVFVPLHMLAWLLYAKHAGEFGDLVGALLSTLAQTLFEGLMIFTLYLALEPFVRRRWPDAIVSWTRGLAGRFRDPLVGRDVLFGCLIGIGLRLWDQVGLQFPAWLGLAPSRPASIRLHALAGTRFLFGEFLDRQVHSIVPPMLLLILLLLLSIVLRRTWIAGAVVLAAFTLLTLPAAEYWFDAIGTLVFVGTLLLSLTRLGLLSTTVLFAVYTTLAGTLQTTDLSAWYASGTILSVLWVAALAGFGFYVALAGRPVLGTGWLPD
ncbi:MAG: protein kinase [Acidobacteria bacterium]|nr:protein kinase [Acidobacteriota bacterium]